jgi:hypothetical protein
LVLLSSACWGRNRAWDAPGSARSILPPTNSCRSSCGKVSSSSKQISFSCSLIDWSFLNRKKRRCFQRFSKLWGYYPIWVISPQWLFFCETTPPFPKATYWNNFFPMWSCTPSPPKAQSTVSLPLSDISYSPRNQSHRWTSPCPCTKFLPPMPASCAWSIPSAF